METVEEQEQNPRDQEEGCCRGPGRKECWLAQSRSSGKYKKQSGEECTLKLQLTSVANRFGKQEVSKITQRFLFSTVEHNLLRWENQTTKKPMSLVLDTLNFRNLVTVNEEFW